MARRVLLLLDGLDEGGPHLDAIATHVTEVLAPQGHTIILTSRPAGPRETKFVKSFYHLRLAPLTGQQQQSVME